MSAKIDLLGNEAVNLLKTHVDARNEPVNEPEDGA
jgi:hypothetical protein